VTNKQILTWLTLLIWNCAAIAQTTQSVGPAVTVAAFRRAMDGVDPASVSTLLLANDAAGQKKIAQLQRLANALARLRAAVKAKFGGQTFYLADHPVQPMTEKIDGDAATVTTSAGKVIHLHQINGQWRIPVKQEEGDLTQQHVAGLQVMTEAIESIAADTEAGRFDTADEVLRAAQEELTKGREVRHAATAPATKP
jgi:hypothetical protein